MHFLNHKLVKLIIKKSPVAIFRLLFTMMNLTHLKPQSRMFCTPYCLYNSIMACANVLELREREYICIWIVIAVQSKVINFPFSGFWKKLASFTNFFFIWNVSWRGTFDFRNTILIELKSNDFLLLFIFAALIKEGLKLKIESIDSRKLLNEEMKDFSTL